MNRTNLIGRTTKDIEVKYTESKTAIAKFNLAVNRKFKNKNTGEYETDFINCLAFNKTAELIGEYVKKGDLIGISGRIQTGSYDNKEGFKVYTTDVVVDEIDFLTKKEGQAPELSQAEIIKSAMNEESDPFKDFGKSHEDELDNLDLPF